LGQLTLKSQELQQDQWGVGSPREWTIVVKIEPWYKEQHARGHGRNGVSSQLHHGGQDFFLAVACKNGSLFKAT
jgi:hypothetical protein